VLGFAFKADTGDTRESAAITLIRDFFSERAFVNIYDPQVEHSQIWMDLEEAIPTSSPEASAYLFTFIFLTNLLRCLFPVKKQVTISPSALAACKGAEAVVIATEWAEFKTIDWQMVFDGMNKPAFVFDGRLLVDAEKLRSIGFKVTTIGRGAPDKA